MSFINTFYSPIPQYPQGGEKLTMNYCPAHCIHILKIPGECRSDKTSVYTSFTLPPVPKAQQNTIPC